MPPHWLQAGPRSRPSILAGTTGGVSVSDAAAGVAGALAVTLVLIAGAPMTGLALAAGLEPPFDGVPLPLAGPAVSPRLATEAAAPVSLATTPGVRRPRASWWSVERNREA